MKVLRVVPALMAAGWISVIGAQPAQAQVEANSTRPVQAEPTPERPDRRDHRRPHRERPHRPERRAHDRGRPDRTQLERVERVERLERSATR